jgi:hypothetical protein
MLSLLRKLRSRIALGDESGFTIIELLTSALIGLITLGVALTILQVTSQGSERVVGVVEANQRMRPAIRTIVDELHSACISPRIAPILAGSTGEQLIALYRRGSEVSPVPDKVVTSYTGNALTRSRYQATSPSGPPWSFAASPYETVPVFRYYKYTGGALDTNPLPTPLSAANAARTVQVTVAFASSSVTTGETKSLIPTSVSNDVSLRFTPATEGVTEENLPCA